MTPEEIKQSRIKLKQEERELLDRHYKALDKILAQLRGLANHCKHEIDGETTFEGSFPRELFTCTICGICTYKKEDGGCFFEY